MAVKRLTRKASSIGFKKNAGAANADAGAGIGGCRLPPGGSGGGGARRRGWSEWARKPARRRARPDALPDLLPQDLFAVYSSGVDHARARRRKQREWRQGVRTRAMSATKKIGRPISG